MDFTASRMPALPALAWAAEIHANRRISAICGPAVETDDRGLIAGAWAGDFKGRAIATAANSIGTALRVDGDRAIVHCGTAGCAPIFFCRHGSRLFVANTMALALAAAGDRLEIENPYYLNDFCTFFYGAKLYRPWVKTEGGRMSVYYRSISISPRRDFAPALLAEPPRFDGYRSYRDYLRNQTALLFANAADSARQQSYVPVASVSSGYDSSASAVIAYEAGCREGITFGEPIERPDSAEDSGIEIGARIGLSMKQYRTFAYKERTDLPEVEFASASFTAGQVFLSDTGSALGGRLLVSGFGGDRVWDESHGSRRAQPIPFYIGGSSEIEFLARAPALSLALPMIGIRHMGDLDEITRSPGMRPWAIGGDYDRPIPRRILEEAGVPRGTFAGRKLHVAGDFFSLNRHQPDIGRYFSKRSVAEFEAWFTREQPMKRNRVLRHKLVADSVGRLLWSRTITSTLKRAGLRWPPFGHRLLRYKVAVSKNFYVFNWALGLQTERYRKILANGTQVRSEAAAHRKATVRPSMPSAP
jgi:hypothetical protein